MNKLMDLKYVDFIKICRLCCKRSDNLTVIYHKTENISKDFCSDDDNTVAVTDGLIPSILLKIGLSVMIESL